MCTNGARKCKNKKVKEKPTLTALHKDTTHTHRKPCVASSTFKSFVSASHGGPCFILFSNKRKECVGKDVLLLFFLFVKFTTGTKFQTLLELGARRRSCPFRSDNDHYRNQGTGTQRDRQNIIPKRQHDKWTAIRKFSLSPELFFAELWCGFRTAMAVVVNW